MPEDMVMEEDLMKLLYYFLPPSSGYCETNLFNLEHL